MIGDQRLNPGINFASVATAAEISQGIEQVYHRQPDPKLFRHNVDIRLGNDANVLEAVTFIGFTLSALVRLGVIYPERLRSSIPAKVPDVNRLDNLHFDILMKQNTLLARKVREYLERMLGEQAITAPSYRAVIGMLQDGVDLKRAENRFIEVLKVESDLAEWMSGPAGSNAKPAASWGDAGLNEQQSFVE